MRTVIARRGDGVEGDGASSCETEAGCSNVRFQRDGLGEKSDHQPFGELGCMQDKQLSREIEVINPAAAAIGALIPESLGLSHGQYNPLLS